MVSVIILTKNEEHDLPSCLEALKLCDDIHVLDSGSIDKTINIARTFGASIWTNPFESFGKQRNFALDNIATKHNWILFLDADEITTEKFYHALLNDISNARR